MISVIIPAHNEQKNVNVTITQIYKALKHLKIKNFEIIFIDDCSTDKTYIYAKLMANKKKYNLKVYKNSKNLGWGGAVKRGIKLSKQKYIVWIPGDNGFYYKQYIKKCYKQLSKIMLEYNHWVHQNTQKRYYSTNT